MFKKFSSSRLSYVDYYSLKNISDRYDLFYNRWDTEFSNFTKDIPLQELIGFNDIFKNFVDTTPNKTECLFHGKIVDLYNSILSIVDKVKSSMNFSSNKVFNLKLIRIMDTKIEYQKNEEKKSITFNLKPIIIENYIKNQYINSANNFYTKIKNDI